MVLYVKVVNPVYHFKTDYSLGHLRTECCKSLRYGLDLELRHLKSPKSVNVEAGLKSAW